MRDEMVNDGYICDGGTWTSPYTGRVTSFQPAREEYMVIQQLGNLLHNSPRNWMHRMRALENRSKILMDRSRQQGELVARFLGALQAVAHGNWNDPVTAMTEMRQIAKNALESKDDPAQATPESEPLPWGVRFPWDIAPEEN